MCLKRSTRRTRVFVGKDVFEAFYKNDPCFVGKDVFEAFYKKDPCVCRQRCV